MKNKKVFYCLIIVLVCFFCFKISASAITIEFCNDSDIKKALLIVGNVVFIFKILVPLAIILMAGIDFFKISFSNDPSKDITGSLSKLIKRLVAGIVIFFIPTILNAALNLIAYSNDDFQKEYTECISCVFDRKC